MDGDLDLGGLTSPASSFPRTLPLDEELELSVSPKARPEALCIILIELLKTNFDKGKPRGSSKIFLEKIFPRAQADLEFLLPSIPADDDALYSQISRSRGYMAYLPLG
jgi:hypothetical protein